MTIQKTIQQLRDGYHQGIYRSYEKRKHHLSIYYENL
jgi:hypothetical protein